VTRRRGRYDLHIHTDHSDGTDPVTDVLKRAAEQELAGISIADHDSTGAQAEAATLAAEYGLDYLTGLELSVTDGENDIHLLAYGFDPDHEQLVTSLKLFRQVRRERAIGMAEKLADLGHPIDIAKILASVPSGAVGRPHLARELVVTGAVSHIKQAFDQYLALGQPAYLPKFKLSPAEGIALTRSVGGVPVLAHPAAYPFAIELEALVELGLAGIETTYPGWDNETTAHWRAEARKYDLIETGGSDYHGSHRPSVPVGAATISREMFERLLTATR
jgi:predicted metal-dependent phosphoesterase TrpH